MGSPAVVAAIDFGTSNTKLAFGVEVNDPKTPYEIIPFTEWESAPGGDMVYAAPTNILFDETGEVVAYGWDVEDTYAALDKVEKRTYRLFKHFKMRLHQEENFSMGYRIHPINVNRSMPAIEVFSKALKYLKDKLIDFIINKIEGLGISNLKDIKWVLTVPAIWKPGARHFMREAAYRAGLCSKATRSQLVIALEPECAAVFVRSQKEKSKALRSTDYAVVDCGGGTVDIAYHSLDNKGEDTFIVRELAPPSGGPYGGTLVDRAFEVLLEKIFGKPLRSKYGETPFIDRLKTEYTDAWMDLMREFEACKTTLYGKKPHETLRFRLDQNFGEACFDIAEASASNLIKQCGLTGVTLSPTKMLLIEVCLLTELFWVPIQQIKQCLEGDLATQQLRSISALYMVGSFSSSALLFHSIQEDFKRVKKENIIRPQESSLAIVKGAVIYGFHPSIIQERISSLSYGIGICEEFDAYKHPQKKKFYVKSTGKTYCQDIYHEFLECRGKIQNTATLIKRTYCPLEPDQTSMNINVYSALRKVRYHDDPGCRHLATIHVPMPNITGGLNREVQIEIEFDGPEIHIVCTDKNTGKSIDESIEFHYG
jgi:hypothetical protein